MKIKILCTHCGKKYFYITEYFNTNFKKLSCKYCNKDLDSCGVEIKNN